MTGRVPPRHYRRPVDPDALLMLCREAADAAADVVTGAIPFGLSGVRPGQYVADLHADEAALTVLRKANLGILSEESGLERGDSDLVVVLDPLDGSTNASRGIPWYATSLCVVDRDGPLVALVLDHVTGTTFTAQRGAGAYRDHDGTLDPFGEGHEPPPPWEEALVGLSGLPPEHLGWGQFRAFGAVALDLCMVACGVLDAYIDCSFDAHGPWDYLGGMLICDEVGIPVVDALGRDLVTLDPAARRTPVAARPELLPAAVAARQRFS